MPGALIVIEGNDGSGKATQSKLLTDALRAQGLPAELVDFPSYDTNVFGALIGECLAGERGDFVSLDPRIASSLYALDRFESAGRIRELLAAGTYVIADRYTSASQIHQGGKMRNAEERTAFLTWLDKVEHELLSIPRPAFVVYLRVPVGVSRELLKDRDNKHGSKADLAEENETYLTQSSETGDWLAEHQPNWHTVECVRDGKMRSREDIHAEALDLVTRLLGVG